MRGRQGPAAHARGMRRLLSVFHKGTFDAVRADDIGVFQLGPKALAEIRQKLLPQGGLLGFFGVGQSFPFGFGRQRVDAVDFRLFHKNPLLRGTVYHLPAGFYKDFSLLSVLFSKIVYNKGEYHTTAGLLPGADRRDK